MDNCFILFLLRRSCLWVYDCGSDIGGAVIGSNDGMLSRSLESWVGDEQGCATWGGNGYPFISAVLGTFEEHE